MWWELDVYLITRKERNSGLGSTSFVARACCYMDSNTVHVWEWLDLIQCVEICCGGDGNDEYVLLWLMIDIMINIWWLDGCIWIDYNSISTNWLNLRQATCLKCHLNNVSNFLKTTTQQKLDG